MSDRTASDRAAMYAARRQAFRKAFADPPLSLFDAGWCARGAWLRSPEAIEQAAEAIYEANLHHPSLPWERLTEVTKEDCRRLARAAADATSEKEKADG